MKKISLLLLIGLIGHLTLYGQVWGDWIDVGYGIQVAFKFGNKPCTFANTYARIRNTSQNTYCTVNVAKNNDFILKKTFEYQKDKNGILSAITKK
ncbi:hypothetical protein DVR12_22790 [Chitinophaga silvatica]|uniref:Uncharacterized protein n=1 Tax=Chitinophaga silvatica TaxID=2282649 RepID=A0A3E1Y454_9BACT|nr:hypothetical protein [Chitinophaga silvatica]RFS19464.1 hypothetical protein DVR12_22790 [Chitinophaga silvatica]